MYGSRRSRGAARDDVHDLAGVDCRHRRRSCRRRASPSSSAAKRRTARVSSSLARVSGSRSPASTRSIGSAPPQQARLLVGGAHDVARRAALTRQSARMREQGTASSARRAGARVPHDAAAGCSAGARRAAAARVLELVEPVVEAALLQQLGVGAALADLAAVHDEDAVGVLDGRQPVRDDQRGAPAEQARHGILDEQLGLGVDARRRLVEHQDRRAGRPARGRRRAAGAGRRRGCCRARARARRSRPGRRRMKRVGVHRLRRGDGGSRAARRRARA